MLLQRIAVVGVASPVPPPNPKLWKHAAHHMQQFRNSVAEDQRHGMQSNHTWPSVPESSHREARIRASQICMSQSLTTAQVDVTEQPAQR